MHSKLTTTTYIEKKSKLSPIFHDNNKLYCQTYGTFSKMGIYLLNYLHQIYKKSIFISFTNKSDFLTHLATKPDIIPFWDKSMSIHVELLEHIITEAQTASDIHFIPQKNNVQIFFRKQGCLHFFKDIKKSDATALFNALKIKAQIDLTKRNIPQNGQIIFHLPFKVIYGRISTLPCLHGESLVIRLHSINKNITYKYSLLDNSTFSKTFLQAKPGLWLITGPIGHGKTTTYYHLLNQTLNQQVLSLEDPIEIIQPNIIQLKLSSNTSTETYSRILLRQNTNIVGVGEIRTQQQLKLAINLAITGHCTLSTFHAGSLQDVQQRLHNFGYNLQYQNKFLKGILFQTWDINRNLIFTEK